MTIAEGRAVVAPSPPLDACSTCLRDLPKAADQCPWCGARRDHGIEQARAPDPPTRGPQAALVALAAITALALVAVVAWLVLAPSATGRQSTPVSAALSTTAASLSGAATTAQLRSIGTAGALPASTSEVFLGTMTEQRRPVELVVALAALTAVAPLQAVSGEAAAVWDAAQGPLRTAAAAELPADWVVDEAVRRGQPWQG